MKSNILFFSLIALALIFNIPATGQKMQSKKKSGDLKEQVQALNDKLAKASLESDHETLKSIYADDIIYLPNYGPIIKGKESMMEYEKKMAESGARMISMNLTTIEVADMGDMVYEIGTYQITMEIPGMGQPWPDKGKYVSIYRKLKDGSLEMVVDIWNTNVNPWEMMMDEKPEMEKPVMDDEGKIKQMEEKDR